MCEVAKLQYKFNYTLDNLTASAASTVGDMEEEKRDTQRWRTTKWNTVTAATPGEINKRSLFWYRSVWRSVVLLIKCHLPSFHWSRVSYNKYTTHYHWTGQACVCLLFVEFLLLHSSLCQSTQTPPSLHHLERVIVNVINSNIRLFNLSLSFLFSLHSTAYFIIHHCFSSLVFVALCTSCQLWSTLVSEL